MINDNPLQSGNQAFLDENYATAVEAYGEVVSAGGEDEAVARSNRAAAFLKLSKHREALQDASAAVKLKPTEIAFYRKGLASFALEEYETALEAFRRGQQAARAHIAGENSDDPRKYRTWIRKCEAEMEAEDDVDNDASKSNGANEGGSEAAAPTASTSSTSAAPMGTSSESSSTGAPTAVAVNRESVSAAPIHLRTKFQYYQSHEKVTVSLLEKGLKEADVEVDIGTKKLTVRRRHDLALLFDKPLYEDVLPEKHKTKFLPSKLEITLTKRTPGNWPELEQKSGMTPTVPQVPEPVKMPDPASTKAKEPTAQVPRPYSSHKDWDVVEKEVKKELEADKPEGEEALNNLFKQIYGNADEDTKRAMVKSFQTSGGTVLSTNWDEVGRTDYEKHRQAPKGMEWRTWEGQKLPQKDEDK